MIKLFSMQNIEGKQLEYYKWMDKVAKSVRCKSFTSDPDLKNLIENWVGQNPPVMKECYRNSWKCAMNFPREIEYVGGYASTMGIPIEHAWNYYKPKRIYFDLTFELALRKNPAKENYLQIIKVKPAVATKIMMSNSFAVSGLLGTYYFKNVSKN